jgi:flagellar hook protein FlgE
MNNLQQMARNTSLSSVQLIDTISGNIAGAGFDGHRSKRWSFSDFANGGIMSDQGYSMKQGKQAPRIGEWTKLYIKGRGFFTVYDQERDKTYYTRLGDFHVDGKGDMVTREGFHLVGSPLEGSYTHVRTTEMPMAGSYYPDIAYGNPYDKIDQHSAAAQQLNAPGRPIGEARGINIALDPRNGKYLGLYDKVKVGEDGILYGQHGNNIVSLYKIHLSAFNNAEALTDEKDGIYFSPNENTGYPTAASADSKILAEALERSNAWVKLEAHELTEAQRYFQFATQAQKLADKISGTAIELIQ